MKKYIFALPIIIGSFSLMSFTNYSGNNNNNNTVYLLEDMPYLFYPGSILPDGYILPTAEELVLCPGSGDPCSTIIIYNNTRYEVKNGEYDKDKYPKKYTFVEI